MVYQAWPDRVGWPELNHCVACLLSESDVLGVQVRLVDFYPRDKRTVVAEWHFLAINAYSFYDFLAARDMKLVVRVAACVNVVDSGIYYT